MAKVEITELPRKRTKISELKDGTLIKVDDVDLGSFIGLKTTYWLVALGRENHSLIDDTAELNFTVYKKGTKITLTQE